MWRRTSNRERGAASEARAEAFLHERGLRTRTRNYRCRGGELDLVMNDGDTLVFVEVRLRRPGQFASALESVTAGKQQRVIRAAQHYLLRYRLTERVRCRFDVVALDRLDPNAPVDWVSDAFTL